MNEAVTLRSHYMADAKQPRDITATTVTGRFYYDDTTAMRYEEGMTFKVSALELARNVGRIVEVGSDAHKEQMKRGADRGKASAGTQTRGGKSN